MRFFATSATALALSQSASAAFGLTSTSSRFIVNTDGGLVFEVNRYSLMTIAQLRVDINVRVDPTVTLQV
jgi:hypothetical protein